MGDSDFMKHAIALAETAFKEGEVPVGAVMVYDGEIIAEGYNKREIRQNSLYHAEIEAINTACEKTESWRLNECTLYVTLEPCVMCTGAIINARVGRVVFGAFDEKAGCMGSIINLSSLPFNHRPQILGGYMENECKKLLTEFFKNKRN